MGNLLSFLSDPRGTPGLSFKLLYLFEDYALDTDRRELRRGAAQLSMEPQVFDVLVFLVRNCDRVVSKDDLLAAVWGGRIVSESTLATRINAARRIIGDSGEQQRLIRTTIGKGVRFVGAVQEREVVAETALSTPPRLSIIVLPFANFSNDPELEFFADEITDDLTTDLSQIPGSFVIARNTAFTLKGESVDVKRIGRDFGASYVVEGSLRLAGELRSGERAADRCRERRAFVGGSVRLRSRQPRPSSERDPRSRCANPKPQTRGGGGSAYRAAKVA